ncbi:JNK-interacting protein 1 isoform X2 [Condylostylus longicornis]|uniref:JNK-interacting protein 1 isoform X2 n=1 Tax=Condylostylus longicornis TaxID=2530218 RepID=UPI00244E25F1|nr:JNK-interacting protein 1 isoform X2 [Condylostylus longicornis]
MADTEFEEFRKTFENISLKRKNSIAPFYSLIPGLDELDDSTSPKSDSDLEENNCGGNTQTQIRKQSITHHNEQLDNNCEVEDDEIGDGLKTITKVSQQLSGESDSTVSSNSAQLERTNSIQSICGERRRRKLPEIPKNKKHEDSSPDSERMQSFGDVDSGHSTTHSPNDMKSMSPQLSSPQSHSPFPQGFGGVAFGQIGMLEATHRGLHKFIPRHHDEIEVEIGDPIYVQKEAEDLWCEGVNLRTGRQGIFPSAYAVDLDYNDFDPTANQVKKERYLLGYLGSVETSAHKGTGVVCSAVRKILGEYGDTPCGQPCILEVSDQGLRMVDRSSPQGKKEKKPCIDYFYSLKNVSFCAFHPRDHRYIGFITKHPTVQRFAVHVFKGNDSTRPVAEAVGRAFQRFYQKFIETAYPIEDIYIE